MRNAVTMLMSRRRGSRVASAPYAGTAATSSTACAASVALDLCAAGLHEDQRLAHRLYHVVGRQDQEDIEREQQHLDALARADVGEETEEPIQRRGSRRGGGRDCGHGQGGGDVLRDYPHDISAAGARRVVSETSGLCLNWRGSRQRTGRAGGHERATAGIHEHSSSGTAHGAGCGALVGRDVRSAAWQRRVRCRCSPRRCQVGPNGDVSLTTPQTGSANVHRIDLLPACICRRR